MHSQDKRKQTANVHVAKTLCVQCQPTSQQHCAKTFPDFFAHCTYGHQQWHHSDYFWALSKILGRHTIRCNAPHTEKSTGFRSGLSGHQFSPPQWTRYTGAQVTDSTAQIVSEMTLLHLHRMSNHSIRINYQVVGNSSALLLLQNYIAILVLVKDTIRQKQPSSI